MADEALDLEAPPKKLPKVECSGELSGPLFTTLELLLYRNGLDKVTVEEVLTGLKDGGAAEIKPDCVELWLFRARAVKAKQPDTSNAALAKMFKAAF